MVIDPLIRDRIAFAFSKPSEESEQADMAGFATWAIASEEFDNKIGEQITAGVYPLRLKPDDWTSGQIDWLLDVVAPSSQLASILLANFKHVVKGGQIHVHPMIGLMVDCEVLAKLGVAPEPANITSNVIN
jgi:cytolysin-activating lysine-acyltransferase